MSVFVRYEPPSWARNVFTNLPKHGRVQLGNFPTPLQRVRHSEPPNSKNKNILLNKLKELNVTLFIKREDMSGGLELGGNKVRKLEFLLADAIGNDYTDVVTIGGEQSNHARATAAACRQYGLQPHLILRTQKNKDLSSMYTGNLLLDRMLGSNLYTCTPGEYGRFGSHQLVQRLCQQIEASDENKKVYGIPVGGSNGLGTWGYVRAIQEFKQQLSSSDTAIDHVVVATGSGGTVAGMTLGMSLAFEEYCPEIHAIGVCDDPDYFYKTMTSIAQEMGFTKTSEIEAYIKRYVTVYNGKGMGYARSTDEELDFISTLAQETGTVLDPVYTGKALYHFATQVLNESFANTNIVFWHTGGTLGLYDKGDRFSFQQISPVRTLNLYSTQKANQNDGDPELFSI